MNYYYMRDNHTFVPLPEGVEQAMDLLKQEFDAGYTGGMLCSKDRTVKALHAHGREHAEEFFAQARTWLVCNTKRRKL